MLTVVTKLLNITKPIATFFGEKDFQQLVLVKQLVSDLNMEINVIGVPTVRDKDGFALSSRNKRLSQTQRELASQIPATLTLLKRSISEGHELTSAINIATEYLTNFPEIKIDYLELRNQQLGKPSNTDSVRALIAVQIGEIRLIDNMTVRD
jgi:pantoate--beta-alanine ligase